MLINRKSHLAWLTLVALGISSASKLAAADDAAPATQPASDSSSVLTESPTNTAADAVRILLTNPKLPDGTLVGPANGQVFFNINPQLVKATYLGIEVNDADATLRAQLKLPDGVGLAVSNVMDQSPAQAAGVQQHDVLYKLNDQLLINGEQFAVLVRTFKPGDKIELTVIREAQPLKLTATLVEKEVQAVSGTVNNITIDGNSPFFNPNSNITLQEQNGMLRLTGPATQKSKPNSK